MLRSLWPKTYTVVNINCELNSFRKNIVLWFHKKSFPAPQEVSWTLKDLLDSAQRLFFLTISTVKVVKIKGAFQSPLKDKVFYRDKNALMKLATYSYCSRRLAEKRCTAEEKQYHDTFVVRTYSAITVKKCASLCSHVLLVSAKVPTQIQNKLIKSLVKARKKILLIHIKEPCGFLWEVFVLGY